jgi:hypothetical protein
MWVVANDGATAFCFGTCNCPVVTSIILVWFILENGTYTVLLVRKITESALAGGLRYMAGLFGYDSLVSSAQWA